MLALVYILLFLEDFLKFFSFLLFFSYFDKTRTYIKEYKTLYLEGCHTTTNQLDEEFFSITFPLVDIYFFIFLLYYLDMIY